MEGLVVHSNSTPPLATPLKVETASEHSSKPLKPHVSFNKTREPSSIKLDPKTTDAYLNYLCMNGRLSEAVAALDSISQSGFKVRSHTLTRLIESCTDSKSTTLGHKLYQHIGLLMEIDPFIETKLVGMYAKCGYLADARRVFDEMHERDLYAWSAMIGACSRERRWRDVVDLFYSMMQEGVVPDDFLFPKILQACGNCRDVETGKLIHSIVIRCGMSSEIRVNNTILAVYAKCGELSLARKFFDKMDGKDKVSWNSIITGYCLTGKIEEARWLLSLMQKDGFEPGLVTWNIFITSYNQLGNCDLAMEVMKEMEGCGITPDVVTWTSMVSGLAQSNRIVQALDMFREMLLVGVEPNAVTLMTAISACASFTALWKGMELHSIAVKMGLDEDVLIRNSLIDLYSKCGKLEAARQVFDMILEKDVCTWNSMISGYCQAGYCGKAHDLFMSMRQSGIAPNVITWNVMITGHMQNGDEDLAMDLFQRMEKDGTIKRDTASWNSLIAGYLQTGQKNKALGIFRQMQLYCVRPNPVTILSLLPACANLVDAKKVKEIHACVFRHNLGSDLSVLNSLIDSYAKAGNLVYSRKIFDRMSTKDIVTWNTMIAGSVLLGCSNTALALLEQMKNVGLKLNRGTFLSVISACGLGGMVEKGKQIFSSMTEDYFVLPSMEHYVAMVHLFGRAGRLEEAVEFIENMTIEPDFSVWSALLIACKVHGNVNLAIYAGERLLELKPGNALIQQFVLQMYAIRGNSDESFNARKAYKGNDTERSLGWSWIEVRNVVHTFVAGDQSKPNSEILHSWVKKMAGEIRKPESHQGLFFLEEENEEISGVHSEKLAIAFALIGSTQASKSIRIIKNLRICSDCHRLAKFISMTHGCKIYLKDPACLHHIKDGHCSCGDYW